jgi:hypothetical protein
LKKKLRFYRLIVKYQTHLKNTLVFPTGFKTNKLKMKPPTEIDVEDLIEWLQYNKDTGRIIIKINDIPKLIKEYLQYK